MPRPGSDRRAEGARAGPASPTGTSRLGWGLMRRGLRSRAPAASVPQRRGRHRTAGRDACRVPSTASRGCRRRPRRMCGASRRARGSGVPGPPPGRANRSGRPTPVDEGGDGRSALGPRGVPFVPRGRARSIGDRGRSVGTPSERLDAARSPQARAPCERGGVGRGAAEDPHQQQRGGAGAQRSRGSGTEGQDRSGRRGSRGPARATLPLGTERRTRRSNGAFSPVAPPQADAGR